MKDFKKLNSRYVAGSGGVTSGGKFTGSFAKGDSPTPAAQNVVKNMKFTGSEKQVAWAQKIVSEQAAKIDKMVSDSARRVSDGNMPVKWLNSNKQARNRAIKSLHALKGQPAGRIIDSRNRIGGLESMVNTEAKKLYGS